MKSAAKDFDQWLEDSSKLNSKILEESRISFNDCTKLFLALQGKLDQENITFYYQILEIQQDRNALIRGFNIALNDYWRNREMETMEDIMYENMNKLLTLSEQNKAMSEECVERFTKLRNLFDIKNIFRGHDIELFKFNFFEQY